MPNSTAAGARASPTFTGPDDPIAEAQQHRLHETMEAHLLNSTNDLNQHISLAQEQNRHLLQFIEERLSTTPQHTSVAVLCILHDELHVLLDHIQQIIRDPQFPSLTRAVPRVSVAEAIEPLGLFLSQDVNPVPADANSSRKKKSRR